MLTIEHGAHVFDRIYEMCGHEMVEKELMKLYALAELIRCEPAGGLTVWPTGPIERLQRDVDHITAKIEIINNRIDDILIYGGE